MACWRAWRGETVVKNKDSSPEQFHTTYASGAVVKAVLVVARSVQQSTLIKRVVSYLRDFGKGTLKASRQSALYRRLTELIKRELNRLRGWGDLQWYRFSER